MPINIRFAGRDDAVACNRFFNAYYRTRRSDDQWRWEFGSSLLTDSMSPYMMAEDEHGAVVGTQAMMAIPMIDHEGVFWTAKGEETLVEPRHRGATLLVQMYTKLFQYAEEHGLAAIWGFTPENRVFEAFLGFQQVATTWQLVRPLFGRSIEALSANLDDQGESHNSLGQTWGRRVVGTAAAWLSSATALAAPLRGQPRHVPRLAIRDLTAAPEDAGRVCADFVKQWGGVTIHRDRRYLQWRIFDNLNLRGTMLAAYLDDRLVGWVVYSLDNNSVGYIVNVIAATGNPDRRIAKCVTRVLLREAVRGLQRTGAVAIRAWRVSSHPYDVFLTKAAKALGFFLVRQGKPMIVHPRLETIARPSMRNFDNWFVTRLYTQGVLG